MAKPPPPPPPPSFAGATVTGGSSSSSSSSSKKRRGRKGPAKPILAPLDQQSVEAILQGWALENIGRNLRPNEIKRLSRAFRRVERLAFDPAPARPGGTTPISDGGAGIEAQLDEAFEESSPELQEEQFAFKAAQVAEAMSQALGT